MAQGFVDRCIFNAAAGGTIDFVVASAVQGYNTPAQSNAVDGVSYRYAAQITEGSSGRITDWEVGTGVYTVSTTTLARTEVEFSSNANAKVSFSSAPQVMLTALGRDFREIVTANRTYYVNKDTGSDSRNGLTIGAAFQTVQKAVDVITQTLLIDHVDITVQLLGSGVWNQGAVLGPYLGLTNDIDFSGPVIKGTAGNRTDITLAPTTPVDFFGNVVCCENSKWTIQDITLDAVNVNASIFDWAIVSVVDANLTIVNPSFGQAPPNAGYYIDSFNSKVSVLCNPINTNSHINIGGGSLNLGTVFAVVDTGSRFLCSNVNWVMDGNPDVLFVSVVEGSFAAFHNDSFSGACTGTRFEMRSNSHITITGADTSLTALPGNAPGVWDDSSCWYNNVCIGPLVLGANAVTGEIDFVGKTSGTTKLRVADAAYTGTIKLPAIAPTNGYGVTTDGSGNWSYTSIAPGGNTTDIQFNSSGAFSGDDALTYAGSGSATIGKAGTGTGKWSFKGTTSGTTVFSVADAAFAGTIKLPAIAPVNGYSVTTDGSGNWTYTNVTGSAAAGGTNGQIQYNNATALGGFGLVTTNKIELTDLSTNLLAWVDNSLNPNSIGIGLSAGHFGTASGTGNITIGQSAGAVLTTGPSNTCIGTNALAAGTTANGCFALGLNAMLIATDNFGGVAIGANAMSLGNHDTNSIAIGNAALQNYTTGCARNIAIGQGAMDAGTVSSTDNIGIGQSACNTLSSGQNNVGVGNVALASITSGLANVGIGTGACNAVSTTNVNTGIGQGAYQNGTGAGNVAVGDNAGFGSTSGDYAVYIGHRNGVGSTGTSSGNISIGGNPNDRVRYGSGAGNITIGYDITVPDGTGTAAGQLCIANIIFGTGCTGTGTTIAGSVGIAVAGPSSVFHVGSGTSGVLVGASPTGGDKGAGTINVSSNIYLNGTAYTNPKWVLQKHYTGSVEAAGAYAPPAPYGGLLSLDDAEQFTREHHDLPCMKMLGGKQGLFDGGDLVLASVEEAYLYIFQLNKRIAALEARAG